MTNVAGFPFFAVQFDRGGNVTTPEAVTALLQAAGGAPPATDLLVLAHGWNNDMAEARDLYTAILGNLKPPAGRRIVVLGVFWPSKRFAESDLIPGGGVAGTGDATRIAALRAHLDELADAFDNGSAADIDALKALASRLDSASARDDFATRLRAMLPDLGSDEADQSFRAIDSDRLFEVLNAPVRLRAQNGGGLAGGPAGGIAAASTGGGAGPVAAAQRLLNLTTFYQMKTRAGQVGAGLNFVLAQVHQKLPGLRIHLVGHSFGARLVTAAIDGKTPFQPSSLVLLQGAFSHNGLAARFDGSHDGFFHNVVDKAKVKGPIAITHTANDQAVGTAYALASRLSGDNAAAVGDASDQFGGIGRNGALHLAAGRAVTATLPAAGKPISLASGKVTNLLADAWIKSHSDVRNPAVVAIIAAALA